MSWVRLPDTMAEDPRFERTGAQALTIALHVAALCYCNRNLTDGLITRTAMRRLIELDDPDAIAQLLVDVDVWKATADGYELLEYAETQPSKDKVLATRAARAIAGKTGGQRSGAARRSKSEANAKQVASTKSNPVPSRKTGRRALCKHGKVAGNDRDGLPLCIECENENTDPLFDPGQAAAS